MATKISQFYWCWVCHVSILPEGEGGFKKGGSLQKSPFSKGGFRGFLRIIGMGFLNRLRRRRDFLSLDWIQIEVTSRCKASCFYCPHTIYRDRWCHGSMSLETFKHIAIAFKMADLIFLQGWGEPFLNKKLFEMIEIAKESGCKVGFTSNGMALNPETTDHLIDFKLDILGISLAGTKSETHDRVRAGTHFESITRSLLDLKEKKERKNASLPRVHLAYIMLRSNFEDLREIIDYAKKVGSRDVVYSNLNFFPSPELRKEAIFLDESRKKYYYEILKGLKARAKENGVNFFSILLSLIVPCRSVRKTS